MNVSLIDLEGNIFSLVFHEEVTIRLIQQKLLNEYNYNTDKCLFCISNQIILNEIYFKELIAKGELEKPIIIYNTQIYLNKFYPTYDNAFQFNSSRYSDYFLNSTANASNLQYRDNPSGIISFLNSQINMLPSHNITTLHSPSESSDSDNEDGENFYPLNEQEFIYENDSILDSDIFNFNGLNPFGMAEETPTINLPDPTSVHDYFSMLSSIRNQNHALEREERESVLQRALNFDYSITASLLNQNHAPEREERDTPIRTAVANGDLNMLASIINQNHAPERVEGDTPIRTAVENGDINMVVSLLNQNHVPERVEGNTPIRTAVENGDINMVVSLLNQNHAPEREEGNTVLHQFRDVDDNMHELILNQNHIPEMVEGETPIHFAARMPSWYLSLISMIMNRNTNSMNVRNPFIPDGLNVNTNSMNVRNPFIPDGLNVNANFMNVRNPFIPDGLNVNANFSDQDNQAIMRLIQAGFERQIVIQVYEACDRNEEAALDLLISMN